MCHDKAAVGVYFLTNRTVNFALKNKSVPVCLWLMVFKFTLNSSSVSNGLTKICKNMPTLVTTDVLKTKFTIYNRIHTATSILLWNSTHYILGDYAKIQIFIILFLLDTSRQC